MRPARLGVSRNGRFGLALLGVSGLALLAPLLLGGSRYAFDVATVALLYGLFVLSWDFFCGATQETSFGHSFLIGVAAYTTALGQTHLGLHPLVAVALGTLAGTLGGAMLGALTLRQSGAVFAMVTMAVQLTFHRSLFLWSGFLGGEQGVFVTRRLVADPLGEYLTIAILSLSVIGVAFLVRGSGFGRKLRACGGDTRVALASGVAVPTVRIAGLAFSGLLAGLGGSLLASHTMLANHEMAGDALATVIFILAVIGGAGSLVGPWIAGFLYVALLPEILIPAGSAEPVLTFGTLLVAVWVMPDGLAEAVSDTWVVKRAMARLKQ